MRPILLSIVLLLGGALGQACANYMVFKVNVSALTHDKKETPDFVSVIVPIAGAPRGIGNQFVITHSVVVRGQTMLFRDGTGVIDFGNPLLMLPSVKRDYENKIKEAGASASGQLQLAEWTLSRGKLTECVAHMESMAKAEAAKPSGDPAVKAALAAYRTLLADLHGKDSTEDRSLPTDETIIKVWKDKLGGKEPYLTHHYAILYDADVVNPPEVLEHARRMENLFHGFYYWFALKGKALPVPRKRMVAVLLSKPEDFEKWHTAFEKPSLETNAFYSRSDNLAVFCGTRLDRPYTEFASFMRQTFWQKKWNMIGLLKGGGAVAGATPPEQARAQTLALVQRKLRDEQDLEAITRVGTRQLVAASGLLPPSVVAPEWIQSGMASFFEISKGSLWPGYGGSSWEYLIDFKTVQKDKRFESDPVLMLQKVITDQYFHDAANSREKDPAKRAEEHQKARLTAWSLTCFLAQRRTDGLLRFYEELSALPRDLELDGPVYLVCFAKALGFLDPTKPNGLDLDKMKKFATEWDNYMWSISPPVDFRTLVNIRDVMRKPPEHKP